MIIFRTLSGLLACTIILCAAHALHAFQDSRGSSPHPIGDRIARLDDRQFPVREQASAELSREGIGAIDELATAYLNGSTEQRWRILKILEQVSIDTEEDGFYRIAATLRVLGGQQYGPAQITALHRKWQEGKSERAAQRLRDAGAKIVSASDYNAMININGPDALMMMGNNRANIGRGVVVFGGGPIPMDMSDPPPTGMIDPESETTILTIPSSPGEKQEFLDDISRSDIDTNRRIAIAALQFEEAAEAESDSGKTTFQYRLNNNIQPFQNQFGGFNDFSNPAWQMPVSIVFGPEWTGTVGQMAEVSAVTGLTAVEFRSRPELSANELVAIGRIPELRAISILDCGVDAQTISRLAELPGLTGLVLDLNGIDDGWMEAIVGLPEITQLRLIAPPGGQVDLTGLGRIHSLRYLSLEGMQIDSAVFERLQEPPFLASLSLQNCKFDLAEYRAFKSGRQQLNVTATGNSFLGVRAPTLIGDLPGFTCRISEVVAGSAADIAGVKPGDLVRKMEGHDIHAFQDLVLVISQKQPGDKVSMEVDRDGTILTLTATLGDKADAPPQ